MEFSFSHFMRLAGRNSSLLGNFRSFLIVRCSSSSASSSVFRNFRPFLIARSSSSSASSPSDPATASPAVNHNKASTAVTTSNRDAVQDIRMKKLDVWKLRNTTCDHQSGEENSGHKSRVKDSYGGDEEEIQRRLQEVAHLVKRDPTLIVGTLDVFFGSPIKTKDGDTTKIEFWRENGYPKPILIGLMRGIVELVKGFEYYGITHWDLRPCCVSITSRDDYRLDAENEYSLYAMLSEECFIKGHGSFDSPSPDVVVALGHLLLFCMTGGSKNDSRATKCLKISSNKSVAEQETKSHLDFTALKNIPEAMHLISAFVNARPDKRYLLGRFSMSRSDNQRHHHPLLWDDYTKFAFLCETSRFVVKSKGEPVFESAVRVASHALCHSIDKSDKDDVEKGISLLVDLEVEAYRCYYSRKLLRDRAHEKEVGKFYMSTYPHLYFELYKVVLEHAPFFIHDFFSYYYRPHYDDEDGDDYLD